MDHEVGHGREITWTWQAKEAPEHIRWAWSGTSWIAVVVVIEGTREDKPFRATHLYCFTRRTSRCDTSLRTSRCDTSLRTSRCDTSLRTTPEALLLQLVRNR